MSMTSQQWGDLHFIKSAYYPWGSYLTIRRSKENAKPENGLICKDRLSPVLVYCGAYVQDIYFLLPEEIERLQKYSYQSVEALLEDGWYVD